MRLTYHTDYALRLLMLLAVEPDRLHTIEEIATRYGISRNHMMKVSRTLVDAGFVSSVKGRNGGLRLARPPQELNLGKLVRATEDNFNIVECFDIDKNTCSIFEQCGLRSPLKKAFLAFIQTLDQYSLQDIVTTPESYNEFRELFPVITDS